MSSSGTAPPQQSYQPVNDLYPTDPLSPDLLHFVPNAFEVWSESRGHIPEQWRECSLGESGASQKLVCSIEKALSLGPVIFLLFTH